MGITKSNFNLRFTWNDLYESKQNINTKFMWLNNNSVLKVTKLNGRLLKRCTIIRLEMFKCEMLE